MAVAIIGAGLCGLTLAVKLTEDNQNVFILEKSKSVGGRMATRRDGNFTYDHGAAYYSHSDSHPFLWNEKWSKSGKAKLWFAEDQKSYFCGQGGMTVLAKDLAVGQKINFQEKVIKIVDHGESLEILCELEKKYLAQKVILTCPVPQSLEILRSSNIDYPKSLDEIVYAKAFVGLFQMESELQNDFDFHFKKPGSYIYSISNNQSKGLSQAPSITVIMNPQWSHDHFDQEDSVTLNQIQIELQKYFQGKARVQSSQLKKWRYSHPETGYSKNHVSLLNGRVTL
ncbi:MAG: FAD-dependent oxidoreductase, partial [Pseudobdellovibrionaceae bacterium]